MIETMGRVFSGICNGFLGFFLKMFLILIAIIVILGFFISLASAWTFWVALIIGIVLSEQFYKRTAKHYHIRLPKYFNITILEFLQALTEGDEDYEMFLVRLAEKKQAAMADLDDMGNALLSVDEQLAQVKIKRKAGTLFKRQAYDISPRMAKIMENELGKPRWVVWKNKAAHVSNGGWNEYLE